MKGEILDPIHVSWNTRLHLRQYAQDVIDLNFDKQIRRNGCNLMKIFANTWIALLTWSFSHNHERKWISDIQYRGKKREYLIFYLYNQTGNTQGLSGSNNFNNRFIKAPILFLIRLEIVANKLKKIQIWLLK